MVLPHRAMRDLRLRVAGNGRIQTSTSTSVDIPRQDLQTDARRQHQSNQGYSRFVTSVEVRSCSDGVKGRSWWRLDLCQGTRVGKKPALAASHTKIIFLLDSLPIATAAHRTAKSTTNRSIPSKLDTQHKLPLEYRKHGVFPPFAEILLCAESTRQWIVSNNALRAWQTAMNHGEENMCTDDALRRFSPSISSTQRLRLRPASTS